MAQLRVTELDFETIKTNLKTFMKSQTEFTDYDFDGAGLNVLIDLLAYNTHYNALLAHLMSNEMFIDTAIKRASVISIAKMLGYIPQSYSTSRAEVSLIVPVATADPVPLYTTTKFSATNNGTPYTFNVESEQVVTPVDTGTGYQAVFPSVQLIEGTRLQNSFIVNSDNLAGPFVIPVQTVDISTIQVSVKRDFNTQTYTAFYRSLTVVDVTDTSKVYWIEENSEGNFQLIFGDGIIGQSLVDGNIVVVRYVACNGSAPNGVKSFSLNGTIGGSTNVSIFTVASAGAGSEKESIDSVRFNAPKYNTTRNRAITTQDYRSLIFADAHVGYKTNSVAVWGGEENIPPVYGKVFITIDPANAYIITDSDKKYIIDKILRPRSVMSIQHEFVDPEYLYLGFNIVVSFNPSVTALTGPDITTLVYNRVLSYFANDLSTLDKTFFYSNLVDEITTANPSILGALVDMRIQNRVIKVASFNTTKNLRFLASLKPDSIASTVFISLVNGVSYDAYIKDFRDDLIDNNAGTGTLKLLQSKTNTILVPKLGTVNYQTGIMSFSNLNISSYLGNFADVRINAIPQELSKNISPSVISATEQSTQAVFPAPAKNIVIKLDDSAINSSIGLEAGLNIITIPFTEL